MDLTEQRALYNSYLAERRTLKVQSGGLRAEIGRLEKLPATGESIRGIEAELSVLDERIAALDTWIDLQRTAMESMAAIEKLAGQPRSDSK